MELNYLGNNEYNLMMSDDEEYQAGTNGDAVKEYKLRKGKCFDLIYLPLTGEISYRINDQGIEYIMDKLGLAMFKLIVFANGTDL